MTDSANPQRAGVYGRQSKDKTKSIDEQTAAGIADADAEGWTVTAKYSDGTSASRFARTARDGWARLLTDLDAGLLDVLVLWESSRGDRDAETWLGLLRRCRQRGVRIRVTSHERTYNPANARDWKALAEDGLDSAYESEKTSVRVRRGTAAAAAEGKPHGRVTYGYARRYNPVTKALVEQTPHDEQAPIVREITRRIGRGEPVVTVVDDLNGRGVPAPRGDTWTRRTVKSIATSPTYLGKRVHGRETYEAIWPALVDEAEHLAAVRVLTDPARKTTRPGRQKWLLSYLARCGVCGDHLHRIPNRDNLKRPDRYQCGKGCTGIRAADIDDLVAEVVCRRLAREDGIDLSQADDEAVIEARRDVARLQGRLDEWRDSAARGETSPASLARIEADLLNQIDAAQRRAVAATTPPVMAELFAAMAEALAALTGDELAVLAAAKLVQVSPDGLAELSPDGLADFRYSLMRERFDALPVAVRRELIALLMVIRVRRADHGGRQGFEPERVLIEWRTA